MLKNTLKKCLCAALAAVSAVACAATFTACETNKPEAEVQLSFNGKTYTLAYQMNRKITPQTVSHFIALADNGYYNGLCVHDYSTTALYTGAYTYTNDSLVAKDYFNTVKSYIPQTVWLDEAKKLPTYTVYGEFEGNNFSVTNGALKESFGSLVMYYTDKEGDDEVYVSRSDGKGVTPREYEANSATSQFYISLSSGSSKNKDYCVFATLDADSVSVLKSLQTAIADYIEDNYGEETDSFITETDVTVNEDDPVVGGRGEPATYATPNEPIIVKSVKITKY